MDSANMDFADQLAPVSTNSEVIWQGRVVRVQREDFEIFGIQTQREIVAHPGAVGVIALNHLGEFAFIKQYRRPIRGFLVEPVAGLLDHEYESPYEAAQRELAEEAGLISDNWSHLIDLVVSPGGSTEVIRFFLAEKCTPIATGRTWSEESEEKEIQLFWRTEDQIKTAILAGRIQNSPGVAAFFTALEILKSGERRSVAAPWPIFDHLVQSGGIASVPLD